MKTLESERKTHIAQGLLYIVGDFEKSADINL